MPDQDNSIITPADETNEGPSQEWLSAHRTTAAELEATKWAEGRNEDIAASRILKQELGQEFEAYRTQLAGLSADERLSLIDKSAEEIAAHLDEKTASEREQKRHEEAREKAAKEQADTNFRETPELRQVRHAMRSAFQAANSLDARIEELQRLNELRDDPAAKGWDDLPPEKWRDAREGKLESNAGEIAALIQEKQAKLQEAAIHQSAYHEGARAIQAPPLNVPIGQIIGNDGQPMPLTRADIATLVQLERDDQAHQQRTAEAVKRYADWQQVGMNAIAAGVDVTSQQEAFIKSLPNSADVVYYLCSHPSETMALARMPSHEATRALINISHKAARPSTSNAPTKTNAPKPPSPVGGASSRAFDVSDESLSSEAWFEKRNADLARRGKR